MCHCLAWCRWRLAGGENPAETGGLLVLGMGWRDDCYTRVMAGHAVHVLHGWVVHLKPIVYTHDGCCVGTINKH